MSADLDGESELWCALILCREMDPVRSVFHSLFRRCVTATYGCESAGVNLNPRQTPGPPGMPDHSFLLLKTCHVFQEDVNYPGSASAGTAARSSGDAGAGVTVPVCSQRCWQPVTGAHWVNWSLGLGLRGYCDRLQQERL